MTQAIIKNRKALSVRLISFLSLFFAVSASVLSQDIYKQAAKQFAADFFKSREQNIPRLKSAPGDADLILSYQSAREVMTPLFVFQQEGKGFAMVAQNRGSFTLVGYSDETEFQTEDIPPQLLALMDYYEDSLQFMNPVSLASEAGIPVVPALLNEHGIKLNQFNHPEVGGSYTGCMATAITQILLFHAAENSTPIEGFGSHCYTYSPYGELCADFANSTYDSEELLSYHVAISLDMRFTNAGSSPSPGVDVIGSLEEYFHYFATYGIADNFYLKNELQHRRPVYAQINGLPDNHAVVVDGYDDHDYFHLNFGWGGYFNGYFLMNSSSWFGTGNAGQYYSNFAKILILSPTALHVNEQDSLAVDAVIQATGAYEGTDVDFTKPVWTWPGVLVMNERVIRFSLGSSGPPKSATSIPAEIGNLTALQELSLYGCFNGTVPSTITQLEDLKKLIIGNAAVYVAPNLYKGDLRWELPEDIDNLSHLEWLSAYNILEGTIPASIGNLSDLKLLFISQDTTDYGKGKLGGPLPAEIGQLGQLQQFHISDQSLEGPLPPEINDLKELRELDLSGNMLNGPVPDLDFPSIGYINLNDNQFSEFADGIGYCPNLKDLQIQSNTIAGSIPPYFCNFALLESLNISDNLIESVPEEISNLTLLNRFNADHNLLQALPDGLALIIRLKELSASNNQIGYVPGSLGQAGGLETLDLSYNLIQTIPPLLGKSPNLSEVYLNHNQIDSIPASFAHLGDGVSVFLQDNEIQGLIPENLMTAATGVHGHVRLDSNRFVFNDIPESEELLFGVQYQKDVPLTKQVYLVQEGDEVSIDIRSITNLLHPANEYYWLPYPELTSCRSKDERFSGMESDPVLKITIDEKNVENLYYCKVFNPEVPSFSMVFEGSTVSIPCMEYLNTDTLQFKLASDEEIIAENYSNEFVTSLQSIPDQTISDGTVTLVPPLKIKRGSVHWEASSDGMAWEKVSVSMEQAELQANVSSVSNDVLVLAPKNTAYYRCCLNEFNCDPLYSDPLKVKALGIVIFDETINVNEEARSIDVDSIEIVVPQNFHEGDFRLTITKIENPPAAPESLRVGSAYDVSVSFGETFEMPLLIKLKNIDKTKIADKEIDRFKAVYFDDKDREWKPFDHAHVSLKDSTLAFTTRHLTKLSWWWDEEAVWGYTDVYERNNIRVFYKDGDKAYMKFGYAKKQTPQAWHIAEIPLLVQDITEFLPTVRAKYKSLGLEVPDGKFSVYVKQMDDAGCVGLLGMLNGYMLIDANMSKPSELRQVLAHEYMHYTQDYYISANPGNSFWMEAHATLSDRIVWNDQEVPLCESEELMLGGRSSKNSMFNFLSNSWDYWDKSFVTNNLSGNIYYNYLAGTFLHYMRSEREKSEKLDAATLLKETSWLGNWRTYLGSYAHNHLNAILGEEYEDFVKFILSGKNENFTLINKKGNPYAYIQDPKNNKVFNHPLSYSFREGEEMVRKDEIGIKVPYMASKIILLENTNPDSMVLVNYKRKHSLSDDHLVYHVSYDFQNMEMTFVDISDSLEFNFLLEARNKENILSRFQNFSFLLLINKAYIGASALIKDFDASFELTAVPVLDIDRIGLLSIYQGSSPHMHTFNDKQDYINIGTPVAAYIQKVTGFDVRMVNKTVSSRILNEHTYQISSQFTMVIDQGQVKGLPTMKDSTIYTQTIDHDMISGTLKITELAHKIYKLNTFIEFVEGLDGDVEEKLIYRAYVQEVEDRTKTYWLNDFMSIIQPGANVGWEEAYGKNIIYFETGNTAETRQMVTKIDASTTILKYNSDGEFISEEHSTYQDTDYSSPDLVLRMIIHGSEE